MVNKDRIIDEFMELVQIDSETKNERKIADVLKSKLLEIGLKVTEDEAGKKIGGNAGNVIGFLPGNLNDSKKILFNAHMDTVQPGKGVVPILENGIIKSKSDTILGADDKAGICGILEMLRVLKEKEIKHGPIQVIFTVAEEGGLWGVKSLEPELIKADMAYVLDSSGSAGHIVVQGPAQKQIKAVISGKAAHAGMAPQDGINAIQIAARAVSRMRLGRIDEETTANIGIIRGGKATNIVPDNVELEGEARSLNREKLDKQCQHMVQCFQEAANEMGGKVEVKVDLIYPEINLSEQEEVVVYAKKAAENLGLTAYLEKTGGGSDANIFNGYGIPTVNLGCGMEKVHTIEEFIEVSNLIKNAEYLIELVKVITGSEND